MRFTTILPLLATTALASPSSLSARQFAMEPAQLTTFSQPGCQAANQIFQFPMLPQGAVSPSPIPAHALSVSIAIALRRNRILRFYRHIPNAPCGQFVSQLAAGTPPGCYPVNGADCFNLQAV